MSALVCRCGFECDLGDAEWTTHRAIWPDLSHGQRAARGIRLAPRADWVAAYTAGATVPAIAAAHGVLPKVVRTHLQRAEVEMRDDRARFSGGTNFIPDVDLRRGLELHAQGLSWPRVAAELGVSVNTLNRRRGVVRDHGRRVALSGAA